MKSKVTIVIAIWLFSLVAIFFLNNLTPPVASLIYWGILAFIIITIWILKVHSHFVLSFSLALFIIASLLATVGIFHWAEMVMRISLIGFLVGLPQSLFFDKTFVWPRKF